MAAFLREQFEVNVKNPDGPKFDRVARLVATNPNQPKDGGGPQELLLDVNSSLISLEVGDVFTLALSAELDDALAENYDYIMHGKVYRFEGLGEEKSALYVSFGGLLMRLKASGAILSKASLDQMIYILLKKD